MALACAAAGCGAACPRPSPPVLQPGDVAIGLPGDGMDVIGVSVEHRWVVLTQARADTDGNGVTQVFHGEHGGRGGDRTDAWMILGSGPGEPIEAFLGATRDGTALAVVQAGEVHVVDAITGGRRNLGPIREWTPNHPGALDASLSDDGHLVWLRSRQRVEVVSPDGHRREYSVEGWIHAAWIDESGTWLVVEALETAPADRSDPGQRPSLGISGSPTWCRGLTRCGGPARRHTFFGLDDPRETTIDVQSAETRAWGVVVARTDDVLQIVRAPGDVETIEPSCEARIRFAGLRSPIVVYTCGEGSPQIYAGGTHRPLAELTRADAFDEVALDALELAEIDRRLLVEPHVQETLLLGGSAGMWTDQAGAEPTLWLGLGDLVWDDRVSEWRYWPRHERPGCLWPEHAWFARGLARSHCIRNDLGGTIAVAPDGRALVMRSGDGIPCGERRARGQDVQLVWTRVVIEPLEPIDPR